MFYKTFISATFLIGFVATTSNVFANDHGNNSTPSEPERVFENWEFTLGLGAMYEPDYMGSDDYDTEVLANIEIVWNDRVAFTLREGLTADVIHTENFKAGLGVALTEGRKASDNKALTGLGDVDESLGGILYANYEWEIFEFGGKLEQDLGSGHEGTLIQLEANLRLPVIEDKFMVMVGPDLTWASEEYMESFFGISDKQAANSAYSRYDVEAGFRDVGLHAMAQYQITDSVSFNVMSQYTRILGDAADSPIVKDEGSENQFFTGIMLNYEF